MSVRFFMLARWSAEKCAVAMFLMRMFLAFVLLSLLRSSAAAQQNQPPSQPPSAPPASASQPKPGAKSEEEKEIEKKEQSQRAMGVVPEFSVTDRWNASPLTSGEKFHLSVKSAFDPATIGAVGLQAGLSQALNEFPGYGQGAQGYGKRFGASLADEVSANFFSGSIPALTGLTNLSYFSVNSNQLSGSIPDLAGLTNLVDFDALLEQAASRSLKVCDDKIDVAKRSGGCIGKSRTDLYRTA